MEVTFIIPDELLVMAMTLVAPRLPDGSVHTFTHAFTLEDKMVLQIKREDQDGKPFYRPYVIKQEGSENAEG